MANSSPRIERGAALLDTEAPGWTDKIDLDMLDVSSETYCVLGQVYGNYSDGIVTLDGDAERLPVSYGFIAQANEDYDRLTDKWRYAIMRRIRKARAA